MRSRVRLAVVLSLLCGTPLVLWAQDGGKRQRGAMARLRARVKGLEAQVDGLLKLVKKQGRVIADLQAEVKRPGEPPVTDPVHDALGPQGTQALLRFHHAQKHLEGARNELGKGQPEVRALARSTVRRRIEIDRHLTARLGDPTLAPDQRRVLKAFQGDLARHHPLPTPESFYVVPSTADSVVVFKRDERTGLYVRAIFAARLNTRIGTKQRVGKRVIDFGTGATLLFASEQVVRYRRDGRVVERKADAWPAPIAHLRP